MKKLNLFLIFIFTTNILIAENISLKEGWNLIGLLTTTTVEKLKNASESIKKVFIYKNEFIESGEKKGIKIELFDVSDFTNPISIDRVVIGEDMYTFTKAFTYESSDNVFALPINNFIYEDINGSGEYYTYNNYLDIYQVDGLNIKSIDKIDGNSSEYKYNYNYHQRGIIFTKNSIDYGIYISGGEVFLKEIPK